MGGLVVPGRGFEPLTYEQELWQDILRDADDFRAKWVIKAKRIFRSHLAHVLH
jgi:hypothetical protein